MDRSKCVLRRGLKLFSRTANEWVLLDWTHEEWADRTAELGTAERIEERNPSGNNALVDPHELFRHAWYAFFLHQILKVLSALRGHWL
jgi:hypothetical protein